MLFLVTQSAVRNSAIAEIARELSLIVKPFASASDLAGLLAIKARRIVCLTADDADSGAIEALIAQDNDRPLGVIACMPRSSRLKGMVNIEWLDDVGDIDALRHATRLCWQRMLTISEPELQSAIDNHEFVIQYQPKVERSSGIEWRTREAESLLRWRHPVHGLLGPLEFLPEIEAFGFMGDVTELVLEDAGRQLRRWRKQGLDLNSCINLAPSLLRDAALPDRYAGIVQDLGHQCSSFTFEVPENDIAGSEAPHIRVLQKFRDRGFRISLDDFGVAASSLSAFEQLPFDEIKIHAAALQRAKASHAARQVLAAVTGLAHNLGISVCAEGVEDQETFEFLKTIECDKMQGFLISEAVMPEIIRKVYSTADDIDQVA